MRIGILSDTHNRLTRTVRAMEALAAEGIEALIHCGDLTDPDLVHVCAGLAPSYFVFGNNDFDEVGLRAAIAAAGGTCLEWGGEVTLAGKRIAVTHGDSATVFRKLVRSQPDYLLFGHTHIALNERDGPTRQINPGSLHRASFWSVAVLDLTSDEVYFVQIVDYGPHRRFRLPRSGNSSL